MAKVSRAAIIRQEYAEGKTAEKIQASHPDFLLNSIKQVIREEKKAIIRREYVQGKTAEQIKAAHPDILDTMLRKEIAKAQEEGLQQQAQPAPTLPTEGPLAGLSAFLSAVDSNPALAERVHIEITVRITEEQKKAAKKKPDEEFLRVLNPVDICRRLGPDVTRDVLARCNVETLHALVRKYVQDPRGQATKWTDPAKVIDYIVERASALARHGEAFVR